MPKKESYCYTEPNVIGPSLQLKTMKSKKSPKRKSFKMMIGLTHSTRRSDNNYRVSRFTDDLKYLTLVSAST
jgi:hypothetical protein